MSNSEEERVKYAAAQMCIDGGEMKGKGFNTRKTGEKRDQLLDIEL